MSCCKSISGDGKRALPQSLTLVLRGDIPASMSVHQRYLCSTVTDVRLQTTSEGMRKP